MPHTEPVPGPRERVNDVPPVKLSPLETPLPVDAAIAIPVLQLPDFPLTVVGPLQLVAAINDPVCLVGPVEVDDVIPDEMDARPRTRQCLGEPLFEGRAT